MPGEDDMSNLLVDARPASGWSAPIDRECTRALHERFASNGGHVDHGSMLAVLESTEGFNRLLYGSMSDGYRPFIGAIFAVGSGKVAISFPHCTDFSESVGTTDRAVSVHTGGDVSDAELELFIRKVTEAIPGMRPGVAVPVYNFDWLPRPGKIALA